MQSRTRTLWLAVGSMSLAALLATYIYTFQVLHREIIVLHQLLQAANEKGDTAVSATSNSIPETSPALSFSCERFTTASVLRGGEECWITNKNGEGYGITTVRGVWSPYSTEAGGEFGLSDESALTTCGALRVTSGNEAFVETLKTLVRDGNSINRLTPDGQLLLTIDTNELSPFELTQLESGASAGLSVLYDKPKSVGAAPCASAVTVLEVVN